MPNHVVNVLHAPSGVLLPFVGEDDGAKAFDFNQFVPSPDSLMTDNVSMHVTTAAEIALGLIDFNDPTTMPADPLSNMGTAASVLHRSNAIRQLVQGRMAKDFSDDEFEQFVRVLRSYRGSGSTYWYEWNIKHWGTKWNAYDVCVRDDDTVEFQTAWSAPHPVIAALASRLGVPLRHEWADEDTGHNVGWAIYAANGERTEHAELSDSKAGYELAIRLWREEADWRWNGSTYEYVDEAPEAS